jgi:putative nucleotidyltransferase with HDIG domain
MADIRGELKDLSLVKLLSWLRNNQKTGFLRIVHGQQRKEFRLRQGEPFTFKSNFGPEQLEVLLASKKVADLAVLSKMRKDCHLAKKSFAHELLNQEVLCRPELQLWMKQSLHLALDNASRWSVGSFMFRPLPEDQIGKPFIVPPQAVKEQSPPPTPEIIIADEVIFSDLSELITTGKVELPPLPGTLMKIRECLNDPNWDNQDLLKVIMTDQLLTTSILKVANSSFYGLSSRVSSLQHAIVLMGMKTIWGIVTHQSLLSSFPKQKEEAEAILDHGFLCALLAKQIALNCRFDEEEAFTCGLLHDIGKVVLYNLLPKSQFSQSMQKRLINRFHCEAGVLIAAKWNLPELVIEAIEYHHHPEDSCDNRTLNEIIYTANCLTHDNLPESDKLSCINLDKINFNAIEVIKENFKQQIE